MTLSIRWDAAVSKKSRRPVHYVHELVCIALGIADCLCAGIVPGAFVSKRLEVR